jgi:uncharacterized damage-inducible protein DinB
MHLRTLTDLYRHMEWADALLWSAIADAPAAGADGKARATLYHVHLVQHAFLRTWQGEKMETPFPTFEKLPGLMAWAKSFHQHAAAYMARLEAEELAKPMPLAWSAQVESAIGRAPEMTTIGDTVLQVALHSIHHRGQLNVRLRELGATPPLLDYIGWVWYGRPAAEWPASIGD